MTPARIKSVLEAVRSGKMSIDGALDTLRRLPFEEVEGVGKLDHHRELRSGVPEVVFGEGKRAEDIARLLRAQGERRGSALATRVDLAKGRAILDELPEAEYDDVARTVLYQPKPQPGGGQPVGVVSAGTSDEPVAAEVAVTLRFLGVEVRRIRDVGVAGLPRTLAAAEQLRELAAVVVIAGMEGALPGVLAGLCDRPIIAVPTSVGYGVGIGGYVAMMAMLATCSPGVTVVNIDNGFGAAVAAARVAAAADRGAHV